MKTNDKIKTPLTELIEEIQSAIDICDNDERKWAYQLIIDQAKIKLSKERDYICKAHEDASLDAGFESAAKDWAKEYFTRTYETKQS